MTSKKERTESTDLNYNNNESNDCKTMKALPNPVYTTKYGKAYLGDAYSLLQCLSDNSVVLAQKEVML